MTVEDPPLVSDPAAKTSSMRHLGAAALLMTTAMALSRVIGFLRESFVAAKFGANGGTDAFVNAFTVPDLTNYLVAGGALSISLLPLYTEYLARGDERQANRLLARIATFVLTVTLLLVVIGEIFTDEIVRGLFHKMDPAALAACVRYTHILFPAQLFFVLGALISTTLYARGRFRAAAFAPLLYNVFIILGGFILGDRLGVEALAWGALVGAIIGPFGIIIVAAYRAGVRFHFEFNVRHPSFRSWLWQTLPLMIGVSLVSADDWILRYFGSDLAGQVTHLNYAKRLVAVPIAVVGQAVGQAAMPFLARLFAEGELKKFADTLSRTLRSTGVIAVVLSAMMMTAAEPLVVLLFQRHKFTHEDSVATARFLAIFAAAIPLWAWQGLVSRAFYSTKNTFVPMLASTIITVVSLPIYAWLYGTFGAPGLAFGSGAGILLHTAVTFALIPRFVPTMKSEIAPLLWVLARAIVVGVGIVAAGRAMLEVTSGMFNGMGVTRAALGQLAMVGVTSVIVTFVLCRLVGLREPSEFVATITRRFRRRPTTLP